VVPAATTAATATVAHPASHVAAAASAAEAAHVAATASAAEAAHVAASTTEAASAATETSHVAAAASEAASDVAGPAAEPTAHVGGRESAQAATAQVRRPAVPSGITSDVGSPAESAAPQVLRRREAAAPEVLRPAEAATPEMLRPTEASTASGRVDRRPGSDAPTIVMRGAQVAARVGVQGVHPALRTPEVPQALTAQMVCPKTLTTEVIPAEAAGIPHALTTRMGTGEISGAAEAGVPVVPHGAERRPSQVIRAAEGRPGGHVLEVAAVEARCLPRADRPAGVLGERGGMHRVGMRRGGRRQRHPVRAMMTHRATAHLAAVVGHVPARVDRGPVAEVVAVRQVTIQAIARAVVLKRVARAIPLAVAAVVAGIERVSALVVIPTPAAVSTVAVTAAAVPTVAVASISAVAIASISSVASQPE